MQSIFCLVTWFSFVLSASTSVAQIEGTRRIAPLETTIVMRNERDYQIAVDRVERAAKIGCRHLNFVVTVNCDVRDDDEAAEVLRYGLATGKRRQRRLEPMTDAVRDRIVAYYRPAMQAAINQGMAISVLCHLDVARGRYVWRNYFRFDPMVEVEGFSYRSSLVQPLVETLAEILPDDRLLTISVAGEMGTSVFDHPESYRQLVAEVRRSLNDKKLLVGVCFNHNGVEGKSDVAMPDQIQSLLDECDYIGFSNYHAVSVPPRVEDFVKSVDSFAGAFARHHIHLSDTTQLQFTEIGLGGFGPGGFTTEPAQAARTLWEGTSFAGQNPWGDDAMHRFRVDYHRELLKFLQAQPAKWPVQRAFLWTDGSWDPQGVAAIEFKDEMILKMIQEHNRKAAQALRGGPVD